MCISDLLVSFPTHENLQAMREQGWEGGKYLIDGFPRKGNHLSLGCGGVKWNRSLTCSNENWKTMMVGGCELPQDVTSFACNSYTI